MKKNKEKKNEKKVRLWLGIIGTIVILANIFAIYNILLLGPIEEIVQYTIVGIFVLIDVLVLIKIRKRRKNKDKKVRFFTFLLILYLLVSIFISMIIMYAYGSISKINKNYVTYSSSLVVKTDSGIDNIKDIKSLKIGLLSDKTSPDGYIIPKEIIDENKLDDNNDIESYDDYSTMMADLYEGVVDAIFITTDYEGMFSSIEAYTNIKDETKIIVTKEKKLAKKATSKRETASAGKDVTEPFTILLIGVDSTADGLDKNTVANGDSLILITFNPKTLNATMLSIPRDSYVPIACWSNKAENKITHAAAYGTDCMMSTIEEYFDVTIDYYAKINFRGLVTLVDTLGGITVDVPQYLCTDNSNREDMVCINEGVQTLNGEQALVLARNRKMLAAGDLDRGLNQQLVVQGIINKAKDMRSINQVMDVLNTITNNLDTNFTEKQILSFYDIAKDIMNNSLQKDDSNLINIEQLFLAGSGQKIYDERSRLVLWNYVPNKASKREIINAMKVNLGEMEPELIKEFAFSINDGDYEKTITGSKPSSSSSNYTLLPDFTGDSEEEARGWANAHGVKVTFEGNGGVVIRQSQPVGKRTDLISGSVVLTLSGNDTTNNNSNSNSTTNSDKDDNSDNSDDNDDDEEIPSKGNEVETKQDDPENGSLSDGKEDEGKNEVPSTPPTPNDSGIPSE